MARSRAIIQMMALCGARVPVRRTKRGAEGRGASDQTGVGRTVLVYQPEPANDVVRPPSVLALLDDLATLAAELHFAGRLRRDGDCEHES